jgi:uncharacterized protein (TIGR00251 family)
MDEPAWEVVADGIVLPVQAQPGARQNAVKGIRQGRLIVAVTQTPEKGKANAALIEILADAFSLKRRQIELLTGETSPQKRFLIRDVGLKALQERLRQLLDPT